MRRVISRGIFTPEQTLLLACCKTQPDPSQAAEIARWSAAPLDWDLLTRLATSHGVMPLLYLNLNRCPQAIPARVLEQLRAAYYFNLQRNRAACRQLLSLVDGLEQLGIESMTFKGPSLAAWAYGDVGHRQFRDMDLLVPRESFLAARDYLVGQGFQPLYEASGEHERDHLLSHYASEFISLDRRTRIDLHWGFARRYSFLGPRSGELWPGRRFVQLGAGEAPTPSAEDTLLLLCLHGSKHGWTELKQVVDVAEAVRSIPDLDWDLILSRASRWGVRRMVLLGLLLAVELLDAPLLQPVRESLAGEQRLSQLSRGIQERVFDSGEDQRQGGGDARRLAMLDNRRDRWRYRWHLWRYWLQPTEKDWSLLKLPRPLALVYYVLRPARVFGQRALRFRTR